MRSGAGRGLDNMIWGLSSDGHLGRREAEGNRKVQEVIKSRKLVMAQAVTLATLEVKAGGSS